MNQKLTMLLIMTISLNTFSGLSQDIKALLILDIQDDFTSNKARMPMDRDQTSQMIENLNKLFTKLDSKSYEIIYIGNEFSKFDFLNVFRGFAAIEGTKGIKQDSRLKIVSNNYFPKKKENAFTNPELDAFLKSKSVKELIISGLKAEACVYSTTKGAIKNGYKVNVLTDCIATTSKRKKDKMLKKYLKAGATPLTSAIFRT